MVKNRNNKCRRLLQDPNRTHLYGPKGWYFLISYPIHTTGFSPSSVINSQRTVMEIAHGDRDNIVIIISPIWLNINIHLIQIYIFYRTN